MKTLSPLVFLFVSSFCFSQKHQMISENFNFTTFNKRVKNVPKELFDYTPSEFQNHPDFGVLPKNSPQGNFIELVNKRTDSTRYFMNINSPKDIAIQKGYGPINYKDNNGDLREINFELFPTPNSGIYKTIFQPNVVTIDTILKQTSITFGSNNLVFSKNLSLFFEDINHNQTILAKGNWSNFKAGSSGFYIVDFFPNVDFYGIVNENQMETNFKIKSKLSNNFINGYLVIKDNVNSEINTQYIPSSSLDNDNKFIGDLQLINSNGKNFTIHKGLCFDSTYNNMVGLFYRKTNLHLDMLVDISWLNNVTTKYPVTIDPTISTNGSLLQTLSTQSMYNSTCTFSNSCNYNLTVATPANTTISDIQWSFTYVASNPCKRSDGALRFQYLGCKSPSTTGFYWYCNINSAGSCAGTNISIFSDFSSCIPAPSCVPYNMNFTMNFYRGCVGTTGCSTDCVTSGSPWTITLFGKTNETLANNTTGNGTQNIAVVCSGSTTMSPAAANGVPGYTYLWSPGGQTTSTKTVSNFFVGTQTHSCTVTDACGIARTAVFNLTSNCVLPIELLSFEGMALENTEALLNWSTATETNNDYFEIQRSFNAYDWEVIGIQKGAGSSLSKLDYSFTDNRPYIPISYYRLKQIDFDKSFEYSPIISVDFSSMPESIINLRPNPTMDKISFNWKSSSKNHLLVEIISFKGESIFREVKNIEIGTNTIDLDLSSYENGLYLIKSTNENSGKTSIHKLLKN